MQKKISSTVLSYLWITAGCAIYALGFNWFFAPNDIAYGGVTGLSQIVLQVLPFAGGGTMGIVFNIPLFLAGWRFLGGHTLVTSLYATLVSSVLIDLIGRIHVFQPQESLLAALYGGLMVGTGLGLIFRQSATTGGTDIGARLLKRRYPWVPTGRLVMGLDFVVICTVALAFQKLNSALYGLVASMVASFMMDKVLYGLNTSKVAYIISDYPERIVKAITVDLDRGVTVLHGHGGYSGQDKNILFCAFPQRQIVALKRVIKAADPNAFLVVCQATEVLGEGFGDYNKEEL